MKNNNITVFDFDGTLLEGDSIVLYCKWLSNSLIEFYLIYYFKFKLLKIINPSLDLKYERVKFFLNRQKNKKLCIEEFNLILKENLFFDSLKIYNA